jgi:uncharacterized protein (DUF433 family)
LETAATHIQPQIGDGIYLVKDVAKILNLDYSRVRRWIKEYWDGKLTDGVNYVFGEKDNIAINFLSLIEFYTFYHLRLQGLSAKKIRELHDEQSKTLSTLYPFAMAQDYYVEKGNYSMSVYYKYDGSLIKSNKKGQLSFEFLSSFLVKVDFGNGNIAKRFFPLNNSKNVVVDPSRQFGQPIINGTNIKTQTIYNLHKGGETNENICTLYDISLEKVQDAISFHKIAA